MEDKDIDPATLEIFKTVLESRSGREWLTSYLIEILDGAQVSLRNHGKGAPGYLVIKGNPRAAEFKKESSFDKIFLRWME